MLQLVEKHLDAIRDARTDSDIIEILRGISFDLGFRSAYLIEYAGGLKDALHILDTNEERAGWWQRYVASGLRTSTTQIAELLGKGGVQNFTAERFTDPHDPMLAFARKVDMVEAVLVPVSYGGVVVGLAGFSGLHALDQQQETALQLLVYALFAQVRSFGKAGIVVAREALTRREKEVIALSAEGLTSVEIAERLGMSARTVNQHVDNVAEKLGTKNRAHTVAEVIRHGLLH